METITFCAERLPSGGAIRPLPIDFDKFPHFLAQGGTGTGKTLTCLLVTAYISRLPGSQVFILDFKNDVDTFKFCHGKDCRYWRFLDCEAGLDEYYNLLQSELASDENSGPRPVRWLWIDELSSWLSNSDRRVAEDIRKKVSIILNLGRRRRFFCMVSVQRASASLFDQARDNFQVCYTAGNTSKEAAAALGFSRDEFLPVTEIGGGISE